jgi:hypothetical protein
MSVPMIADMDKDRWGTAPTGFILTPQVFITVRYAHVDLFDVVTADLAHQADLTPALAFVCCWKGGGPGGRSARTCRRCGGFGVAGDLL